MKNEMSRGGSVDAFFVTVLSAATTVYVCVDATDVETAQWSTVKRPNSTGIGATGSKISRWFQITSLQQKPRTICTIFLLIVQK